jgi:predicted RNA-binding protein
MAKLSQLLTLERMLNAYDNMNTKDAWIIEKHAVCTGELMDDIIAKLTRLLNSKTTLSCRNVLVANFETMTKAAHWLKCRLFTDLPKAMGNALREKIVQMVDLLKALMVKIIDVDEFAERFFERLKKRYRTRRTTDYELWKARQSKITIKRLVRYQVDLTAEMLSNGILMYAEAPNGEEIQNVDKDKLALTMTDKNEITETFINECAKLRRYSHWEGDRFVIDYPLLRKYLFCVFGKLNSDQHIQMFEYDVQMKQIHEDIERLRKEEGLIEEKKEGNGNLMSRMRRTIDTMRQEGELKHLYDYTWLMMAMNENCDLPSFDTPTSFREYLINIGIKKGIPNRSTISKYYDKARGQLPNWTFDDADGTEAIRRNNVGKRFLNLVKRE